MHSIVDVSFLPFFPISILNSCGLLPPPANSHPQLMLCLLFSVEFRTSLVTHIKNGFMYVRLDFYSPDVAFGHMITLQDHIK